LAKKERGDPSTSAQKWRVSAWMKAGTEKVPLVRSKGGKGIKASRQPVITSLRKQQILPS